MHNGDISIPYRSSYRNITAWHRFRLRPSWLNFGGKLTPIYVALNLTLDIDCSAAVLGMHWASTCSSVFRSAYNGEWSKPSLGSRTFIRASGLKVRPRRVLFSSRGTANSSRSSCDQVFIYEYDLSTYKTLRCIGLLKWFESVHRDI